MFWEMSINWDRELFDLEIIQFYTAIASICISKVMKRIFYQVGKGIQ